MNHHNQCMYMANGDLVCSRNGFDLHTSGINIVTHTSPDQLKDHTHRLRLVEQYEDGMNDAARIHFLRQQEDAKRVVMMVNDMQIQQQALEDKRRKEAEVAAALARAKIVEEEKAAKEKK